ncbi:MAG: hypothetical protein MJ252_22130 [archaeon]|nr:hypothetical protein [archaeon]
MNLKLFQQECAKKLLILLRDFDSRRNQKEKIEAMILQDLHNIWSEIKKPKGMETYGPEKFFSFEFVTLPHKVFAPEEFNTEVGKLKARLNTEHPEYLFGGLSDIKSVPADGLKQYVDQIWNIILNEKELNIVR